jgi:hypothetical protein
MDDLDLLIEVKFQQRHHACLPKASGSPTPHA